MVGIVRAERRLTGLLRNRTSCGAGARGSKSTVQRQYNPGWHMALDLIALLFCSEVLTRAALERRESRGGHTRLTITPNTDDPKFGRDQYGPPTKAGMEVQQEPLPPMPAELKALLKESSNGGGRAMKVFRGDVRGGDFREYRVPLAGKAWWCSMPSTISRPKTQPTWRYAGIAKPVSAARVAPKMNGKPRLTCMTRMDQFRLDQPITVWPMQAFPIIQDLVTDVSWNYEVKHEDPCLQPKA